MRRLLIATALAAAAFAASAQTFTVVPGTPAGSSFVINNFDATNSVFTTKASFLSFINGLGFSLSNAVSGTLNFTNGGVDEDTVTAEYFGKEASFTNVFTLTGATGTLSTATSSYTSFGGDTIGTAAPVGTSPVMGLFSTPGKTGGSTLFILNSTGTQALGLFNDIGSSDKDFDDMVVRFNGTAGIAALIPEPSAMALVVAGLATVGFLAVRRRKV